jgi:hypothetical protein
VRIKPPGYRRTFCVCSGPVPTVDWGVIRIPAGTWTMIRHFGHSVTSSWTSRLPGSTSPMDCRASRQSSRSDSRFALSNRSAALLRGQVGVRRMRVWHSQKVLGMAAEDIWVREGASQNPLVTARWSPGSGLITPAPIHGGQDCAARRTPAGPISPG